MYDEDYKIHISNDELPSDFSLEDILAEYKAAVPEESGGEESLTMRSKRIVMEAIDQTISEASFSSIDDIMDESFAQGEQELRASKARIVQPEPEPEPEPEHEPEAETAPEETPAELTEQEEELIAELTADDDVKIYTGDKSASVSAEKVSEFEVRGLVDSDEKEKYASPKLSEAPAAADAESDAQRRKAVKEKFLSPIVAIMALVALKQSQNHKADSRHSAPAEEEEDIPELEPEKAAKLYGAQMQSLRARGKLAAFMCLIMLYLSFAFDSKLPLFGALNGNVKVMSLVLLVFELTVMVIGLDIVTAGIMGIVRKKPGFESLAAVSCIVSAVDAAVLMLMELSDYGIPYCAVSALSLTFCIWGSYYTCRGCRTGFRLLAMSKKLYTVTGERGISGSGVALLKSRGSTKGFINRSEEADFGEYIYSVLGPVIIALAVILGLIAGFGREQGKAALHCISAMISVSASFSAAICFSLPFAITARKLFQSGAAIAGWSGVRDIGKSRHIVISDGDIFPQGTVEVGGIRILEGAFTDKVISYTGSVIAASGCGLVSCFSELIRRNGYTLSRVENFTPHDGGGMVAMVNGESVYVGNAGFMNLMGIRVPQKLNTKNSVYTAVNGALVGIFTINYKPISSVQAALVLLLRSNREPIFAIRDFNITPMMIKKKFNMPTDMFEFPGYTERYRISGAQPDKNSRIAALISREGMGPLVDAADRGRRLYSAVYLGSIFSAAGSVLGLILMFMLCWLKAFDSATAGNMIIFMLLWLMPSAVLSWGLQR